MDKPRPGKTTFVIMVSPLPGKYELLATHRPAPSSASHSKRTVTSLAPPPHPPPLRVPRPGLAHPGNSLRNLRVATRGTPRPGGSGTGRLCALFIYIRHAPAGMSRSHVLPRRGARPTNPTRDSQVAREGRAWASGGQSGPGVGTWEDTRPQCLAADGVGRDSGLVSPSFQQEENISPFLPSPV